MINVLVHGFLTFFSELIEYDHGYGFSLSDSKLRNEDLSQILLRIFTAIWEGFAPHKRGSCQG